MLNIYMLIAKVAWCVCNKEKGTAHTHTRTENTHTIFLSTKSPQFSPGWPPPPSRAYWYGWGCGGRGEEHPFSIYPEVPFVPPNTRRHGSWGDIYRSSGAQPVLYCSLQTGPSAFVLTRNKKMYYTEHIFSGLRLGELIGLVKNWEF